MFDKFLNFFKKPKTEFVKISDEEILQIYKNHFEETGVQEWGMSETIFNPVTFAKEIIKKNSLREKS